jgi:hypothetical protein
LISTTADLSNKVFISFYASADAWQAAEKVCTEQEGNTSGAKALIAAAFYGRLKSCPDTKHEVFPSL